MEPNQPPDNNADFEPREDVVSLGEDEFKAAFGESLDTKLSISTHGDRAMIWQQ
jgi:hypothetical protein